MENAKRIVVVGGVAGGASAAARARRIDEHAKITVFEKGPFVSFANCGLPYYVSGVIEQEKSLLLANPALFKSRFEIDARVGHEVLSIDRAAREVVVRDLANDRTFREPYDALVLATGAQSVKPPLPGLDLPGVFSLRTIPDANSLRAWIQARAAKKAVVVGGGFIGVEAAENLRHLGLDVAVVEAAPQVLPPMDPEMVAPAHAVLRKNGVALHLGEPLSAIEQAGDGLVVVTSKSRLDAQLVLLALGVRPDTRLAKEAGLAIGVTGGLKVNEHLQTSDPAIWAVGDVIEVTDYVTGKPALIPLAGPANRQGRIAAEAICGRPRAYRGTQGTAVCGFFGLTAASTGASEKTLKKLGIPYETITVHPAHHTSYYPGAQGMTLKLLFAPGEGKVLGAQAVGGEGVDKRIDVIAMAIQQGAHVADLEEAELCYAPQFGNAKDAVNMAGMVAMNHLRGDLPLVRWEDVPTARALVLDVRENGEWAAGHVPDAKHIPLGELRRRVSELPKDREVWTYCAAGQRSYYAVRLLLQHGVQARQLPGGFKSFGQVHPR